MNPSTAPSGNDSPLQASGAPLSDLPKERYDLRILSALRRIIRAVDIYSRRLAQEHGVTVPQLLCMLKIDERGPMTQRELSEAVYLNPSTIVGIIDRLEKASLFARQRSETDRRQIRISLTENGKRMIERSPSPIQESLRKGIDGLPELQRATIALSLESIIDLIDAKTDPRVLEDPQAAPVLETSPNLAGPEDVEPLVK